MNTSMKSNSNGKEGSAMSRTRKDGRRRGGRDRHISVRAVRRDPPDLRRLSRALIQLAITQAAAEAAAEAQAKESGAATPEAKSD
jgi:hypothetical protein